MSRRRRGPRETAFGFDSFMDVIANVIGIIIRFILVAWVGARSYHSMMEKAPPQPKAHPKAPVVVQYAPSVDWDAKIATVRYELQQHIEQARLAKQKATDVQQQQTQLQSAIANVDANRNQTKSIHIVVENQYAEQSVYHKSIREKLATAAKQKLSVIAQLKKLKKSQPKRNALLFRTPISRPVTTEELHFECKNGRVTYVDFPAFLAEIRRGLVDKGNLLKTRWQVTGVTQSVGAFRARYTIERRANFLDGMVKTDRPVTQDGFSFGLARVLMEPIRDKRGETATDAFAADANFRAIIESTFPQQTAVVFWVYPDSFPLYRRLRDALYDLEFEVAARPLPMDVQIGISKNGTASQAQ